MENRAEAVTAKIAAVTQSEAQFKQLIVYLKGTNLMATDAKEFIDDLQDYNDTLLILTEGTTAVEPIEKITATQISELLVTQYKLLGEISSLIQAELTANGEAAELNGQKRGALQRLQRVLTDIQDLNQTMLQENLNFQRQLQDVVVEEAVSQQPQEKKGFFKRIFGQK